MRRHSSDPVQEFPVVPVAIPRGEIENRGARRKFWVTRQDDQTKWLLKFPRPNTGEHWAEKVASEIGGLFGIETARVELARAGGELATICKSFLGDDEDESSLAWLHGSELLTFTTPGYDVHLVRPNRSHSIKTIVGAIWESEKIFDIDLEHSTSEIVIELASYALLDALIGNTDRHHDNWMVEFVLDAGRILLKPAPSFDHASSIGRELTDTHREQILSANGVLDYLKRGRGGVFREATEVQASSPLRLARLLCRWRPELASDWRGRLNSVSDSDVRAVTERVPAEFASETAKQFAYQVVVTSKNELLRSIR